MSKSFKIFQRTLHDSSIIQRISSQNDSYWQTLTYLTFQNFFSESTLGISLGLQRVKATFEPLPKVQQEPVRPHTAQPMESKRNPSGIQAESMASMELNGIKWNQMESNRTNRRQILKCRFSYGLVILVTHYRTVSWTEKNSDLPWDFLSKRHMTPSWRNIPNKTNK